MCLLIEDNDMNNISVIGLVYVGLPTAILFANKTFKVIKVNIDAFKVEIINNGRCYVHESRLAEMFRNIVFKASS
jgi:UDP-N-acetyl-D-mannosaminuronate dehydrogenase